MTAASLLSAALLVRAPRARMSIDACRQQRFPENSTRFLVATMVYAQCSRPARHPEGFPIATLDRRRPAARLPRHDRPDIEIVGVCACCGSAPSRPSIQAAGSRHSDTANAVSAATDTVCTSAVGDQTMGIARV